MVQAEFLTRPAGVRNAAVLPLDLDTWQGSVMGRRVMIDGEPDWGAMRGLGITLSFKDILGRPALCRVHVHVH